MFPFKSLIRRAIEDLRQRKNSGSTLEANQRNKLASEESILRELRELGVDDTKGR